MGRFHILAPGMAIAALALGLSSANATPADDACSHASPSAAVCVGADKLAERAAAECRRVGLPANDCRLPLGHQVGDDIVGAYEKSWVHRTAAFQYQLGAGIPLQKTKWLGTHNSFNSVSYPPTLSQTDSNQQLTLTQQLEIDMRSLELDVHWINSVNANGQKAVVVCHARGPDEQNLGCTNERLLKQVLPEIAKWLNTPANRRQVILLYLEDELGDPAGYAQTVQVLDAGLKRADGSSLIYRPRQSQLTAKGCADLPLKISRDDIRRAGAQVVLVGNCRSGWASDVFSWDDVHVESGSTPRYKPYPACDATYSRHVYDTEIVRYYEDSTWLSSAVDPTGSPDAHAAESLTPSKVAMMTPCGVNLFGFDQLLPDDGRIAATIWSWAQDKPNRADGRCTVQRSDTRWITRPCGAKRRTACSTRDGWRVTRQAITFGDARRACQQRNGTFSLPPTGYENMRLRAVSPGEVWLAYRLP